MLYIEYVSFALFSISSYFLFFCCCYFYYLRICVHIVFIIIVVAAAFVVIVGWLFIFIFLHSITHEMMTTRMMGKEKYNQWRYQQKTHILDDFIPFTEAYVVAGDQNEKYSQHRAYSTKKNRETYDWIQKDSLCLLHFISNHNLSCYLPTDHSPPFFFFSFFFLATASDVAHAPAPVHLPGHYVDLVIYFLHFICWVQNRRPDQTPSQPTNQPIYQLVFIHLI